MTSERIRDKPGATRAASAHVGGWFSSPGCVDCAFSNQGLCETVLSSPVSGVRAPKLYRFRRDTTLCEAGREPGFFGIVKRGYLRNVSLKACGQRDIFVLYAPGDHVGALPGQKLDCSLEAATNAEVCLLDNASLSRLMHEDARFRRLLLRTLQDNHAHQLDMIWRRGALTSRERIWSFLVCATQLFPADQLPDGSCVVTIELPRTDWADLTGTTVELISRTMTQLAERGLVYRIGARQYHINDVNLLARVAGLDLTLDHCHRPYTAEISAPGLAET